MQLVDTNVWLALTFESHAHHPSAKSWIDSTPPQSCCFCRVTQMGFLRLATNRRIFPADAVPMDRAWELYGRMLTDLHIVYAEEPVGLDTRWQELTQSSKFSTNVWTDAYLAAFAITADIELVTFDQAFTQFKGLRSVILK